MAPSSVHAVIPNYNMASGLEVLLPEVLEQEYDSVHVLDDASTDESLEVLHAHRGDITVIAGTENVGAGANRNRIIDQLGGKALIHFIDADMRLEGERLPERCQDVMSAPNTGFVGGLVKDSDGRQMVFNYGPRQSLRNDATVPLHLAVSAVGDHNPEVEGRLRKHIHLLDRWPNRQIQPVRRETFWTTEANMIIGAETFNQLGGYDANLREHEIQDLALRLQERDLTRYFDPAISAIHTAIQVRNTNRNSGMANAEFYIARKHGLLKWLASK